MDHKSPQPFAHLGQIPPLASGMLYPSIPGKPDYFYDANDPRGMRALRPEEMNIPNHYIFVGTKLAPLRRGTAHVTNERCPCKPKVEGSAVIHQRLLVGHGYILETNWRGETPGEVAARKTHGMRQDSLVVRNNTFQAVSDRAITVNGGDGWINGGDGWIIEHCTFHKLTLTRWETVRQWISEFFHWLFQL